MRTVIYRAAYWLPFVAMLVIAVPSYADELDDRIAAGIDSYASNCPQCGGWMQQLFSELRADADSTALITVSTIKAWMISNQRQDGNVVRDERMGTLSHAMQTAMGSMQVEDPNLPLTADEYLTRVESYLAIKYPPPPEPEPPPIRRNKGVWI